MTINRIANDLHHFNGRIDEVRIYERALSSEEVSEMYSKASLLNSAPYVPSLPSPQDIDTNVPLNTTLSWTDADPDSGDTVTYDVYFGTANPPSIVSSDQSPLSFEPSALSYSTTYYWKIVATDNHGATTEGPVWSFTTISASDVDNDGDGYTENAGD